MILTLNKKKEDFLQHSKEAFEKHDLNDARQAAEAFCKIIVLKEHGEDIANQIFNNQHEIIKAYSFNLAIDTILFKNKINNDNPLINKTIKSYLQVLQNHGNLDSHDDDFSNLDIDEVEFGLYNLVRIIKFLYIEYFESNLPFELESILAEYEKNLKLKIEENNLDWKNIKEITNDFHEQQQRFILITDKCKDSVILSNLSSIPWSYIGDFDKDSHKNGLYSNVHDSLHEYRDTNLITLEDHINYSKSTTFWDFLNGYSEINESVTDSFRKWQKEYIHSNKVKQHIQTLYNGGISTSDIFVVIFWEDKYRLKYILEYLNILDDVLIDSTHILLLSTNEEIRETLKKDIIEYENITKYNIYNLSIENFSILVKNREITTSNDILIPAFVEGNESHIKIEQSEFLRYQDDLRIFPYSYNNDSFECESFYRGQPITFLELENDCDINRDIGKEIEKKVLNQLKNRNSQLIYLLSEPSAGTTTIINRILWNLRDQYPSFELINYKRQHTYEFFQSVYTNSNKPILIFADHKIHEDNIKNLTSELNTKNISYVILYVNRFMDKREAVQYKKELEATPSRIPYMITENLSKQENNKFYRVLGKKFQDKQELLLEVRNSRGNISPFKYLFTIFLDKYVNLDSYINDRLDNLNNFQLNRIKYLSLIQYYTGLDVTVKFLTNKINKASLFNSDSPMHNLIVYEEYNDELKIEFIHNIICEKILERLSNVTIKRAWKQKLADIGIDFLEFIEKEHSHNKDNIIIKDIINRLFIKRNITTYDSENRSSIKYYTDFIEDLNQSNSAIDARERIFKKLISLYPEDTHYLAHLGRFYSVDRKNLDKSLEYINKAIFISENEGKNDSILSHMKGMSYNRELNVQIRNSGDINNIIDLGEKAEYCFKNSREFDTQINNHYPFISHAQMLLNILRFGRKQYDNDIYKFIDAFKSKEFIANIIDNIENLVSDFEVIRTKSDDYSDMKKIKNELWELQGDIGKSLEMLNNLLDKNTHYNPVIRRNIVRLTVHKYKENINEISEKQIKTLINHLEKNLDNFSLEESNTTDLLLWIRLIRHNKINIDILKIADVLTYIKTILDEESALNKVQKNIQIIILYYLHIIKFSQYYHGDNDVFPDFIEIKKELKLKAMYLDGKSLAREWLHSSNDINLKKVINWYDKRLNWVKEEKFFNLNSEQYLEKCTGIIREISSQKTGVILYKNIEIHFIPRADFTMSNINEKVEFYLSFSYDQMSAWKVKLLN